MTLKKTSNSITIPNTTFSKLSIQVSLNGLSFCVLDTLEQEIIALEHHSFNKQVSPEKALKHTKAIFEQTQLANKKFKQVQVLHENELSAWVPASLFDKDKLSNYLKYSVKIFETDEIAYDTLTTNALVNVYVPFTNLNNYFFDCFGEFNYKHASTVMVQHFLQQNHQEKTMFAVIANTHFELVVTAQKKLLFYNTFTYNTPEDFIYYILFTAEQLGLNPETFALNLTGNITKESALFEIAYNYIRNVSVEQKTGVTLQEHITNTDLYSTFLLTHSF